MSQANLNFPVAPLIGNTFMSDLAAMIAALASLNSGASAPVAPNGPGGAGAIVSYQQWADVSTTPPTVRMYNSGTTTWVATGTLDLTQNVWNPVNGARHDVADASYAVARADNEIFYTSISAARTVTLLAANKYPKGYLLPIGDGSGSASATVTISAAPNGADTINGSNTTQVVVDTPRGISYLESDGTSAWVVRQIALSGDVTGTAVTGRSISTTISVTALGTRIAAATENTAPVPSTEFFLGSDGKKVSINTLLAIGCGKGGYVPGRYYFGGFVQAPTTTGALTANTMYFVPWEVTQARTFSKIGVNVTVGAGTNARLGIYKWASGLPSTLVLDAGAVNVSALGAKEATISQALDIGIYCLAIVCDGAPTVSVAGGSFGLSETIGVTAPGSVDTQLSATFTYGALPASVTFGSGGFGSAAYASANLPSLWLRV